jgi:hypothetical protein
LRQGKRITSRDMTQQSIHENFFRGGIEGPGSERSFGFVMAAALSVLAVINGWHDGRAWPWLGGAAFSFAVVAYLVPGWLSPLNKVWYKFGILLHALVSPIVMGLLFYVAIWPAGLVFRLRRRDLLRLKRQPESSSYWIVRQPPGPAPGTMKDQF